jgi:rhodanese-related sulfurtransferase
MSSASIKVIKAGELADLWNEKPELTVIDVRTPGEFETVHARGAKLHPLHDLDPARVLASHSSKDQPLYILCKSGGRATKAAEQLLAAGFDHPIVVEGGTDAWVAANLPAERSGRNVIPLDGQMRAAAGVLIFLGALLALTVNSLFAFVPLFMGIGLFVSGITGLCPMTGVIAKLPWNRASGLTCQAPG